MSFAPSLFDSEDYFLRMIPLIEGPQKFSPSKRLWQVPGGYFGRLRQIVYTVNYHDVKLIDLQSFVRVTDPDGNIYGEWLAPQTDATGTIFEFLFSKVTLSLEDGVTLAAVPDSYITGPRSYGSLPDVWLQENYVYVLVLDTDNNDDFLSDCSVIVEGQRAAAALADVVPPYTAQTPALQAAETVAA